MKKSSDTKLLRQIAKQEARERKVLTRATYTSVERYLLWSITGFGVLIGLFFGYVIRWASHG